MVEQKAFGLIRYDETEMVAIEPISEYFGWGLVFMQQIAEIWKTVNMNKEEYLQELAKYNGIIYGTYKLSYFQTIEQANTFIAEVLEPRLIAVKLNKGDNNNA